MKQRFHFGRYRVDVGVVGCEFGVKQRLRFARYRMAVGAIGCGFGVKQHLYFANYRVAVGPLVGQGWERKRPTLSKLYISPFKAVGLGLFTF